MNRIFRSWYLPFERGTSSGGDMLVATLELGCLAVQDKPQENDLDLVRAVAKGDRSAFERLFRLYHARIYKFSIRVSNDQLQAEEVACDTLYAVWKNAPKFREQSAVSSWILGIAYKRSLKSYNKNARHTDKRESGFELDEVIEQSPDTNPERVTNDAMEIDQISKALSTLSTDHRAVLELIALGYSGGEIASIVGCPENTVKTRTFHARRQLRTAMQENHYDKG